MVRGTAGSAGLGAARAARWENDVKDYQKRRLESIAYIQQMLGELRTLSEIERCNMLTYLIEMAYVEAGEIRRGQRPMRVSPQRLAEPVEPPLRATA